ncbi:ABC transporter permease [Mesorhizobium sp. YR577]|uniref:ABC transporter permease n=1 Tax=Mesorhizobium sp. YR577 TaxID=1884373 RepID=UPI0008E7F8E5|nr:ABC transporter permease [Mesorhizobium sp. YR577]SFT54886.1 monosaccharide ABC transporter membrane protein, CUT2 family [Mesorhizobium sp. YR577]
MNQTVSSSANAVSLKNVLHRFPFVPALVILVALVALNGFFEPRSLSFGSVTGLFSTYLALMLLAVAQTYVVFAGDIDLSVGAIVSLVNVVIIVLMEKWGGSGFTVITACLVGVLTGVVCGVINGIMIAGLRLQAIVATFATSIFFTGLALYVLPVAGTPAPEAYWLTYGGTYFGIPFVFYVVAAVAIVLGILARTRLTTQMLSVGDDAIAAFQTGLPVTLIRIKGYVLCGLFSALAALCITGDTASGDPLVGGKMTLFSVAAVVLGGSALSGGAGTVTGSLVGALIIGLINSLVFFVGTPSEWQNLVQGLAILIALMAGILVSRGARS